VPHVADTAALLQQVEDGASVRTIAAKLGVTERTVRNRLSRAGIPLPRAARDARIDVGRSSPATGPEHPSRT